VLYDSINYLIESDDVLRLFSEAARILKPNGRFIFDAATPFVCETAFRDYEEKDVSPQGFPYVRRSWYDAEQKIQYNHFTIRFNGQHIEETHQQKIRSLREWRKLLAESPLQLVAAYGGFGFKPAQKTAERIHFVCEKR
jgi:SAM-dependent methyltransferase